MFTKLFSSITTSSIWNEDSGTRIVWITMLALANKQGYVSASVGGLAHEARVSKEVCEAALKILSSPDEDSRSKEFEGRRIEVVDGGFQLLNYEKYRAMRSEEERREYMKTYMVEYRRTKNVSKNVNDVSECKPPLAAVSRRKPPLAEAEAEAEAEEKREKNVPSDFKEFWKLYPKKTGKDEALRSWKKLSPSPELLTQILAAVAQQAQLPDWKKEKGQFIPMAKTWLNNARWEDEITVKPIDSFAEFVPHFKLEKNEQS